LNIGAGQIRLTNAKANGAGADLAVAGVFDLTNGTLNARLTLTGADAAAGTRPDIFVALNGPFAAPSKTLDVSGLTGWLTLRAIDQQSKKLEAIEAAPDPQPAAPRKPEPSTQSVPTQTRRSETSPAPARAPAPPRAAAAPAPQRPAPQQAPHLPPPINIMPLVNPPPAR
jgi:large subunit ribosomal protein L24